MMTFFRTFIVVICGLAGFAAIALLRDTGYAGPHHDEVIGLLASKGLERDFDRHRTQGEPPFHGIATASVWQKYTREFVPLSFRTIRDDVMSSDKHPPLAFWVFNRWLSGFQHGAYGQAVMLTWLQVVAASVLLAALVFRYTDSWSATAVAWTLFLLGNSAVFTAIWVRQYALFVVWYAAAALVAGELARHGLTARKFVLGALALAAVCVCGVMTQYTFVTMNGPMHLALVGLLAWRREWRRLGLLCGAYLLAAAAFFILLPGAIQQARAVSGGMEGRWQIADALYGLPQMLIPWPSFLPAWLNVLAGVAVLSLVLGLAGYLCYRNRRTDDGGAICVVVSGMLGAGVLQFLMVAIGLYPGWATGPNHLCAFWLLSVFALAIVVRGYLAPWLRRLVLVGMVGMLAMQIIYGWHGHRIKPRTIPQLAKALEPDLAILDNPARGFVLELTEVMVPSQPVLVTDPEQIVARLERGEFREFHRIVYLPVDERALPRADRVVSAFAAAGWRAEQQVVVHPGLYDAWLLTLK